MLRKAGLGGAHFLARLAEEQVLLDAVAAAAVSLVADCVVTAGATAAAAAAAAAAAGLGGTTGGLNLEPQNLQNLALSFCSTPVPSLQSHKLAVAAAAGAAGADATDAAAAVAVAAAPVALAAGAELLLGAAAGNFLLQNL